MVENEAPRNTFLDYEFGFAGTDEFITAAENFVGDLKGQVADASVEDLIGMPEEYLAARDKLLRSHRREIHALETWLKTPEEFFAFVDSLYNYLTGKPNVTKDKKTIVKEMDKETRAAVLEIDNFLQSGIQQTWGYDLIQTLWAVIDRERQE